MVMAEAERLATAKLGRQSDLHAERAVELALQTPAGVASSAHI